VKWLKNGVNDPSDRAMIGEPWRSPEAAGGALTFAILS
jgi:hypothetical protein